MVEATPMVGITNGPKTRPADPLLTQWDTRGRMPPTSIAKFSATIKPSIQPKAHHGQYLHQP
jgi:hypothetical protein